MDPTGIVGSIEIPLALKELVKGIPTMAAEKAARLDEILPRVS